MIFTKTTKKVKRFVNTCRRKSLTVLSSGQVENFIWHHTEVKRITALVGLKRKERNGKRRTTVRKGSGKGASIKREESKSVSVGGGQRES